MSIKSNRIKLRTVTQGIKEIDIHVNSKPLTNWNINDTLYFGVNYQVFTYKEDAIAGNLFKADETPNGSHYQIHWLQLRDFLKYLLKRDGHLILNKD